MIITIKSTAATDFTPYIERVIADAPEGAVIIFEPGTYFLSTAVQISDKKDLTLEGTGAVLSPYFNCEEGSDTGAGVFVVENCKNLTIRGFNVSGSQPANVAGTVINATEDYADVRLNIDEDFTGREQVIAGMIFNDDWSPMRYHWISAPFDSNQLSNVGGELACSAPRKLDCPHEMLDGKTIRVYSRSLKWQHYSKSIATLKPGTKCNISHTYYGLVAFTLKQCDTVLFEDVTLSNYAGFGFLVCPHCRDFTFRRVNFESADREHQPYALNSDGIHFLGLSGKLLIEDCNFDAIGDDRVNVHTQVMTVKSIENEKVILSFEKKGGKISPYWSAAGDLLRVYNPETLELKGKIRVVTADCGNLTLEPNDVDIQLGDYITNDKYYPEVTIRRCKFHRNGGRQLCLQGSDKLLIEDCEFYNTASCSLYLSTAFDYWYEAGPLSNVTVRNNLFRDLITEVIDARSTILVQINGERHQNIPPVHKNILIENNRFENICVPPVIVKLTDGVTIRNNQFINCNKEYSAITTENCANVICENNTEI